MILEFETRKVMHQPSEVLFRSIQPMLWLLMFGQAISHEIIQHDSLSYIDFITPGILAQSVLFIAIFNGIAVIWERDMGVVQKLVVAPVPRAAIVLGKGLGSGMRALSQLIVVYILALFLGVNIEWSLLPMANVILFVILGAVLFSTFSLVIACIVKTRERFMGIGQVLTMPLFFASNAIYPLADMPPWLNAMAHVNPLTYEVDALRAMMLTGGSSAYGIGIDFAYMMLVIAVLTVIGAILYPQLAR
ncbi:MAG TPA: ABC transporter permease [Gammaproteobacteria bacterium]|nr:ABC transporter permease [Gammaproteobacteria bacterium]